MGQFLELLAKHSGFWKYPGKGRYLAKLASGKVSDCYANSTAILNRPDVLNWCIREMLRNSQEGPFKVGEPTSQGMVVGPAMGGITLAYELARQIHPGVVCGFTEPTYRYSDELLRAMRSFKESHADAAWAVFEAVLERLDETGKTVQKKGQVFDRFEFPAKPFNLFFVEDVVTTGASTAAMVEAVLDRLDGVKANPRAIFPTYILCLIDRRSDPHQQLIVRDHSFEIRSLEHVVAYTWDTLEDAQKAYPEVTDAIKPKLNWQQLVEG